MRKNVEKNSLKRHRMLKLTVVLLSLHSLEAQAEQSKVNFQSVKDNVQNLFTPKSSEVFRKVQLNELSKFEYDPAQVQNLPLIN